MAMIFANDDALDCVNAYRMQNDDMHFDRIVITY